MMIEIFKPEDFDDDRYAGNICESDRMTACTIANRIVNEKGIRVTGADGMYSTDDCRLNGQAPPLFEGLLVGRRSINQPKPPECDHTISVPCGHENEIFDLREDNSLFRYCPKCGADLREGK